MPASGASSGQGNTSETTFKDEQNDGDSIEVGPEESEVGSHNFQNICWALESSRQNKKPRPMPQLIPLSCSTPTQNSAKTSPTEPTAKRFKDAFSLEIDIVNCTELEGDITTEKPPVTSSCTMSSNANTNASRKKNASFFDRLKERLMTETSANGTLSCKNCGFESKCLSEHSVHEKNCTSQPKGVATNASTPSVSSTRCQNCRHRCKSSADLYVHMQTCKANADEDKTAENTSTTQQSDQPHPMENVVFVWNTVSDSEKSKPVTEALNITITDDSSMTDMGPRSYDSNNVDALHDTEADNLSPSMGGKRVFKCPHCAFWASTASRFHVHIVGHLNKKPFECSICNYKSNWRWDITKHIKLKSIRDNDHEKAKVLMTDETGRRNYSKYSQYMLNLTDEQLVKSLDHSSHKRHILMESGANFEEQDNFSNYNENSQTSTQMPLDLQTRRDDDNGEPPAKKKKTLWKCKKCNFRDPLKEALLEHVREHSKQQAIEAAISVANGGQPKKENGTKEVDLQSLAYQCGHCNQLSNWKHVIQRHCRLKHNGEVKVLTIERPKTEPVAAVNDSSISFCTMCPFNTNDKNQLSIHVQQHSPSPNSIFKCYFCPYFVKTENDLMQHLNLHGISNPEEYVSKAMGNRTVLLEPPQVKRHKCADCPYETNSKSQYMYHEQFHRLPANTPYKCQICNYSVSKRHLLHQHMKVHGLSGRKELENDIIRLSPMPSPARRSNTPDGGKIEDNLEDIPYVWVSAKNEFHKMYKCRYCSYVNSQQCKIPNHEKIHIIWFDNDTRLYKCLECKFTCDNAPKLTEHSKIHGEIYGRIYYSVDSSQTDEEQIAKLRQLLEQEKHALLEDSIKKEPTEETGEDKMGKMLHFCKKCPSRFFGENELQLHEKFHELKFAVVCKICSFTVPQESQMAAHSFVHTDDYQSKTKMLQMVHDTHPDYPQPKIDFIKYSADDEQIWIIADNFTLANEASCSKKGDKKPKMYYCTHCPAKFAKNTALTYHISLHGGPGSHQCKQCDFTVKNIGNLVKHESLHKTDSSANNTEMRNEFDSGDEMDYKNVPLSGTDLFQRKTEAQKRQNSDKLIMRPNDHFPPVLQADPQFGYLMHGNPEFIYPTYMKNGRQKEKRYKCHKCPSAFEKREQYKVHLSLHGSKQRYKCELCDYSVKYYANYVQHMRKHQMNAEAHAERNKLANPLPEEELSQNNEEEDVGNVKLAIKTIPKYTAKSDFQQFSIGDQQTLRLLQRRRSSVGSSKDDNVTEPTPEKEVGRKQHACPYCPYSNQRRDSLENHLKKHKRVSGIKGNHECSYCDFSCNQIHFLREHCKIHFSAQKNCEPKCYTHNDGVVLTITKIDDEEKPTEINFIDFDEAEACSKAADKIFIQPATGEPFV